MPSRPQRASKPAKRPARRPEELRRSSRGPMHRYFVELFENASDIILINDRGGRIVAANRTARDFGGYTLQDVERGVHLQDVLTAFDAEAALLLTQRALDGLPVPEVYEREAVLRDGSHHVLELRSNVLRRRGQPALLQTIGRDVTERKAAAAFQNGLLQVSQALLTAKSLDEIGRVVCEEASRVLHVDGAYLWLRRGDELVGCAAAGQVAESFIGARRRLDESQIGEIYRASDVLVVNDFQHSLYGHLEPVPDFGVQAMLAVPLRRQGPGVGVLVFTDTVNPRPFTSTLRERAMIFGAQTAVAIESALAREREEEEGRVSAALLRVTQAIRESLEEAEVVGRIARSARDVLECDWAAVGLRDASKDTFRVTTTEGWSRDLAEELALMELTPDLGLVSAVLNHRTVEIPEPRSRPELFARWAISSLLAVPMSSTGRVVGVLCVGYRQRSGPFSPRERRIAEGIAAQAAVAVQNARLVEDLRAANQLKSEFLGTMSHELRTPLNAILGYAELMREGVMGLIGSEQAEVLDRIQLNGQGLLELINMTLDVNRLEAGRVTLQPSAFSLTELFTELRNEFSVRAAREGVTLTWPDSTDSPPLHTDHGKLKAVLRNLIDNALKFTPQGSVTVTADCTDEGDRIWVSVRDTGVGIAREAQASIFEMFRQLDGGGLPARGGVGLGLYLVRRYSELLGGKVSVDSAPGEGSTFTVEIPRELKGKLAE